jgi:hypothetical protein
LEACAFGTDTITENQNPTKLLQACHVMTGLKKDPPDMPSIIPASIVDSATAATADP